eukprot:PhM_4_TR5885/c0_g1_i1/m.15847
MSVSEVASDLFCIARHDKLFASVTLGITTSALAMICGGSYALVKHPKATTVAAAALYATSTVTHRLRARRRRLCGAIDKNAHDAFAPIEDVSLQRFFPNADDAVGAVYPLHMRERMLPHVASSMHLCYQFEGRCDVAALRKRVQEVVRLNPWLRGVLVTPFAANPSEPALWVPHNDEAAEECFLKVIAVDTVKEMRSQALECGVPCGRRCLETGEVNCRMTLLQCPSAERFVFILSLSHTVGDGATGYTILNMLSVGATAFAMTPKREGTTMACITCLGPAVRRGMIWYLTYYANSFFRAKFSNIRSIQQQRQAASKAAGRKTDGTRLAMRFVDPAWIERQKAQHHPTPDVPFLSTNDVLTAWLFKNRGHSAGVFIYDLRNRIPGITSAHSGNYLDSMLMFNANFTPSAVRRMVSTQGSGLSRDEAPYAFHDRNATLVSNWSTFCKGDLALPGVVGAAPPKLLLHSPMYFHDFDVLPARPPGVLIFRANADHPVAVSVLLDSSDWNRRIGVVDDEEPFLPPDAIPSDLTWVMNGYDKE